jgi:TetR/AcrR family transcriptional regulator
MRNRRKATNLDMKILEVAKKHFLEKGFAGASMGDIAKEAKTHKSIIYYYFESKEELWKKVKDAIIEGTGASEFSFDSVKNLGDLLDVLIDQRIQFYCSNEEYGRLLKWESLQTEDRSAFLLIGFHPSRLINAIKEAQERGDIKKDLNPEDVFTLIIGMTWGPFMLGLLNKATDPQTVSRFIKSSREMLVCALRP